MEIKNENPSLFAKAVKGLIDCLLEKSYFDGKLENMMSIWFPHASVQSLEGWMNDELFPDQNDLRNLITVARVFIKDEGGMNPVVAFAIVDSLEGKTDAERSKVLEDIKDSEAQKIQTLSRRQAAGKEFLSVLELKIFEGFDEKRVPEIVRIVPEIDGNPVRSISEYYFSEGRDLRDHFSVFNADLTFDLRQLFMNRFLSWQHGINEMMRKVVYPASDESANAHNSITARRNFSTWSLEHRDRMYDFGIELEKFIEEKNRDMYKQVEEFIANEGRKILLRDEE